MGAGRWQGAVVHSCAPSTDRPDGVVGGLLEADGVAMTSAAGSLPDLPAPAVRARDAGRLGLVPNHLRRREWQRLSYGLYARTDPERSFAETVRLTTAVLPRGSGFGHLTGARLRGWWLPNLLPPAAGPLFASTTSGLHVQREGLYVRRSDYTQVEDLAGVPVVTAAETLIELARDLSLVDLVPMVDCALAAGASAEDVLAAARPRSHGARALRRAVDLADPRSESWWESVLRVLHVLTGLGPVDSQVELFDGDRFVARADLHLVGTHRYPECDGGEHRSRERHEQDLARDKGFQRLGLERYGYTTGDIARRPETVIADAERARGLGHDPRRARRWWRVARCSTLTPYGRTRLLSRLQRYRLAAQR